MASQTQPQDIGTSKDKHHLPHYHIHKTPQYAIPHGDDHRPLTPEQNAENLAKYQREHADLLSQNRVSHGGHSEGDEYTPSKGAHHLPHYHFHKTPQYAFPHGDDHRPLTPEQNAENLAKYQRDHADLLAQNRASHGGGDDGERRRSSIRVPDFLKPIDKEHAPAHQAGIYDDVKGPLFHHHNDGK